MDILFKNVEHLYQQGTPFERRAIYNINTSIASGAFFSIIGHTGSGKSTLMQHINGLLKPSSGKVKIGNYTILNKKSKSDLKQLRKRVGIVFQYPEHQLFEETIEKDICFGPLNFGVPEEEAKRRARIVIKQVGLNEEFLSRSPFELSGGQKRRVAIAGVLVMRPDVLILDEPTAGLDPKGRKEIMGLFHSLHHELKMTTVLVTHSMEDAAQFSDEIIVMDNGTVLSQGSPTEIFSKSERLQEIGLSIPESLQFKYKLEEKLGIAIPGHGLTVDDVMQEIYGILHRGQPS
jgi:energy-coupling factor transport system ATP-binding protein